MQNEQKISSITYFDVVFLRNPDVVNRGVVGGTRSHVCAGEVRCFFRKAVLSSAVSGGAAPHFILRD